MLAVKQYIFLLLTIWLVIITSCSDEPGSKLTIRLEAYDIEDDPMFFRWSSTGGSIQGDGNGATWIAPKEERRFQINVNVSDGSKSTNGLLIIQV